MMMMMMMSSSSSLEMCIDRIGNLQAPLSIESPRLAPVENSIAPTTKQLGFLISSSSRRTFQTRHLEATHLASLGDAWHAHLARVVMCNFSRHCLRSAERRDRQIELRNRLRETRRTSLLA